MSDVTDILIRVGHQADDLLIDALRSEMGVDGWLRRVDEQNGVGPKETKAIVFIGACNYLRTPEFIDIWRTYSGPKFCQLWLFQEHDEGFVEISRF